MNQKKTQRLYMRVTPQEKRKIEQLAEKCGLSQSEYLRKRALGFVPKEVPPGAFLISAQSWTSCAICVQAR